MGRFRANVPRRLGKTAKDRGEIAMNMIRSAKNQIAELTAAAYRAAVQEGLLPEGVQTIPAVEIPKDTANGDYTTTFCLAASKAMRKNPREVAKILTMNISRY